MDSKIYKITLSSRVCPSLKDKVVAEAKKNGLTVSHQIESILETYFRGPKEAPKQDVEKEWDDMVFRLVDPGKQIPYPKAKCVGRVMGWILDYFLNTDEEREEGRKQLQETKQALCRTLKRLRGMTYEVQQTELWKKHYSAAYNTNAVLEHFYIR